MTPERHRRVAGAACLALASALSPGCASTSIGGDIARVRELSGASELPGVADADVDPAAAEDARHLLSKPLDADAAVRVALLNNRELRATLRELGVARGRLVQAGLLPNPIAEAEWLPERDTRFELRVEYDITRAVLAPMRAHAAEPELAAGRYRAAGAVVDLGYRVRVAFYALQAAEQRLRIAERVLDGQAARRDATRAMHAAGNLSALDAASEEASYERARVAVAELELEAATARERVQRLLGAYAGDLAWRVAGELEAAPERPSLPDRIETRALRASLELGEARQRLEGLARRAGVERTAGLVPDVSADVHGLYGDPEADAGGSSEGGWRYGAGVSVGIPLFDRRQGTVGALSAEFDALLERYHGMAVDLRSQAREARGRVQSSHARARRYQEVIVPAQRRVTEQTLLQYNAMQLGVFQLLEARREELSVELAYVETLREYWSALAELHALLAGRRVTPAQPGAGVSLGGAPEDPGGH